MTLGQRLEDMGWVGGSALQEPRAGTWGGLELLRRLACSASRRSSGSWAPPNPAPVSFPQCCLGSCMASTDCLETSIYQHPGSGPWRSQSTIMRQATLGNFKTTVPGGEDRVEPPALRSRDCYNKELTAGSCSRHQIQPPFGQGC